MTLIFNHRCGHQSLFYFRINSKSQSLNFPSKFTKNSQLWVYGKIILKIACPCLSELQRITSKIVTYNQFICHLRWGHHHWNVDEISPINDILIKFPKSQFPAYNIIMMCGLVDCRQGMFRVVLVHNFSRQKSTLISTASWNWGESTKLTLCALLLNKKEVR